jgi:hypothetical protein
VLWSAEHSHGADASDRYIVKALVHASEILDAFESSGEVLRLRDVVQRTGFSKGMCFRLLHTLHHCGFIEKVDELRFRMTAEIRRRKRYRIGYAAQRQNSSFAREVHASLVAAAPRSDIELIVVDNRYQPKIALRNADHLVRHNVDLVIEFQTDEAIAPEIASRYLEAGIPIIAIDIPHPGATYFGANNYQAGRARRTLSGPLGEEPMARRGGRDSAPRARACRLARACAIERHPRGHRRSAPSRRGHTGRAYRRRRTVQDFARAGA